MNAGKYARSSAILKELLALDPKDQEARRLSATLQLRIGSLANARPAFDSMVKDAMERQDFWLAESLLKEYLAAGPRCVPFIDLLGQVLESKGDPDAAAKEYAKGAEILLEDPDPNRPTYAHELFRKAADLDPHSPAVFRLEAMLARAQETTPESVSAASSYESGESVRTADESAPTTLTSQEESQSVSIPEAAESAASTGERAKARLPWEDDGHNVDVSASPYEAPSHAEGPVGEVGPESAPVEPPVESSASPLLDGLSLSVDHPTPNVVATDYPVQTLPDESLPTPVAEVAAPAVFAETAAVPLIRLPIQLQVDPSADAVVETSAPTATKAEPRVMAWDEIVAKFSDYAPPVIARKDETVVPLASPAASIAEPEPNTETRSTSSHDAHRFMGEDSDSPSPRIEATQDASIVSSPDSSDASTRAIAAPMPWEQVEESVDSDAQAEAPSAAERTVPEPVAAQEVEPEVDSPLLHRDGAGLSEGPTVQFGTAPVELVAPLIRIDAIVPMPPTSTVPAAMPWEQVEEEPIVLSVDEPTTVEPIAQAASSETTVVDEASAILPSPVADEIPTAPIEVAPEPVVATAPTEPAASDAPSNDQLIATILDQTLLKDTQAQLSAGMVFVADTVSDVPRSAPPVASSFVTVREPEPIRVLLDSAIVRDPAPSQPTPITEVAVNVVAAEATPVASAEVVPIEVVETPADVTADVTAEVASEALPEATPEAPQEPEPVAQKPSAFSFFPSMLRMVGVTKDESAESAAQQEPLASQQLEAEPNAAALEIRPAVAEVSASSSEKSAPHALEMPAPIVAPEPTRAVPSEPALSTYVKTGASEESVVDVPVAASHEDALIPTASVAASPADVPMSPPVMTVESHQATDVAETVSTGDSEHAADTESSGEPVPSRKKRGKKKSKRHADEVAAHAAPDPEPPAAPMSAFVAEPIAPVLSVASAPPATVAPPAPVPVESAKDSAQVAPPTDTSSSPAVPESRSDLSSQREDVRILSMPSAKSAKPRDGQDGAGVWSHVAGAAQSGGRAASSLTKLVVSLAVATVGVGLLTVGGLAITWGVMNQSPSPTFQELIGAKPQTSGDAKHSGYALLSDIGLSDAAKAGTPGSREARFACYDAVSATPSLGAAGPATGATLSGWFREANPVAAMTGKAASVKDWVSQSSDGVGRYRQWLGGSGDDAGYGRLIGPSCPGVLAVHRLHVAEPVATGQGLDVAMDRLESDLTQWRSALRKAQSLDMKMLAVAAVNDDLRLLSSLLLLPDFDAKYYGRAAKAAVPLDQAERSLRSPMQSQFQVQRTLIDAAVKNAANAEQPWYVSAMAAMPLPTQRMLNGYADYYQALIKASEEPGEKFTAPTLSTYVPASGHSAMDYLLNPVAAAFEVETAPAWETYVGQVRETDALLRLVSLQVWLRKSAQESTGDVKARVAKAGQHYYDPFTGFPMLINASKGLLYSVGSNGRDEDGAGPGDVSVLVPTLAGTSKK